MEGAHPIRGHLLATGEDAPHGEAAGDARLDLIARLPKHARLLAGVMPRFVSWVLATPSVADRVKTAFVDARREILGRLDATGTRDPGRIAQNRVTNAVAFAVVVDWLEDAGAIGSADAQVLRAEYAAVRDRLLVRTTRGVQDQRASVLFVERLGALLDGGTHALAASAQAAADPTRTELGWREGDVVYLTTGAFDAAGCGPPAFVWTAGTVRRQLEADGMLADRGTDQLTVQRQLRATAMWAEALGFVGARDEGSVVALPRAVTPGRVA